MGDNNKNNLEDKYSNTNIGLPFFDTTTAEKMYDPYEQKELPVFLGYDSRLNAYDENGNSNIKLLNEICETHDTKNFRIEFMGLTSLQRSIMIARMTGFHFYQIERILKMTRKKIIKELEKGMQKLVKLNVKKCNVCKFRVRGKNKTKRDRCKILKIKVRASFYCFIHKENKNA